MSRTLSQHTQPTIIRISLPAELRNLSRHLHLTQPQVQQLFLLVETIQSELRQLPIRTPTTRLLLPISQNDPFLARSPRRRWNSFITAATTVSGSPLPTDLSTSWFISTIALDLSASTQALRPITTIDTKIGAVVAVLTMLLAEAIPLGGQVSDLINSRNIQLLSHLPLCVLDRIVRILRSQTTSIGSHRVPSLLFVATSRSLHRLLR